MIADGGKLDESIANSLGDSVKYAPTIVTPPADKSETDGETATFTAVSYTHLTLPTILLV